MTESPHSKSQLYLLFTVVLGLITLLPQWNFQSAMAVGDHGLNLYAFQRTAMGETPYQDFWWAYGPLFPYYYAGFMNLFGDTIWSVFIGRLILIFTSGLFAYLTLVRFTHPLIAMAASGFFWIYFPDFFYSYNHTGIITLFFVITYLIFSYFHRPLARYFWLGLPCLYLMSLARINMGFGMLFGFVMLHFLTDRFVHDLKTTQHLPRYFLGTILVVTGSGLTYWWFLQGLPEYAVHQCLPYFSSVYYEPPKEDPFYYKYLFYLQMIGVLVTKTWRYLFFFLLLVTVSIQMLFILKLPERAGNPKRPMRFSLGATLLLMIIAFHEFLLGNQIYRINWIMPFQILLFALCIYFASKSFHPRIRNLLYITVLLIPLVDIARYNLIVRSLKIPEQYIQVARGGVYTKNPEIWHRTVEEVTNFLNTHLDPEETFFAMPYEPLYYFLTKRKSPSWHTLLMEGSLLSDEQELAMIESLKDPQVKYVLLSNRYYSREAHHGTLGETHLIDLAEYVDKNFETAETFGQWDLEAGWNFHHGVKILKRIPQEDPEAKP